MKKFLSILAVLTFGLIIVSVVKASQYGDGEYHHPRPRYGCTDKSATNYDEKANRDNGSCQYPVKCTDETASNYNEVGECKYVITDTDKVASVHESVTERHDFSMPGAPICTDGGKPKYAPTITKLWRDKTGKNVDAQWTTTDTQDFVLFYGPTGKDLIWNTGKIHGQGMTIRLEKSQMIDAVACSLSPCGITNCGKRFIDP